MLAISFILGIMNSQTKRHIFYIGLIILLILIFYSKWVLHPNSMILSDKISAYHPRAEFLKKSVFEYGDLWPLWTPYWMGGRTFLMSPGFIGPDSLMGVLMFLPTTLAIKLNYLLNFLIAGISMYILMLYLKFQPRIAFLSAVIYIFNGFIVQIFSWGWLTTINAYALAPLLVMAMFYSVKAKQWVKYTIVLAIAFAIQLRAGPDLKGTSWFLLVLVMFYVFHFLSRKSMNRAIKVTLILLIFALVFFGLSAQRILPHMESIEMTSKASLSFEQSASRKLHMKNSVQSLITSFGIYQGRTAAIGVIAFLLGSFAIWQRWRKKTVRFFVAVAILGILLSTGSFVYYLLWKYIPPFDSMRYVTRALVLWVFSFSVLAGLGASILLKKVNKNIRPAVFGGLILLIVLELMIFAPDPYRGQEIHDTNLAFQNNYILHNLSKEPGIFRIQNFETIGIDWGTEFYTVPLGLEPIYGYISDWIPEYVNLYLSVALRVPAKFWGMLNVKYVTSTTLQNVSGFKYIRKYKACEVCYADEPRWNKAWGPYLYENELFMPRAVIIDKGILVIGAKDAVLQNTHMVLALAEFDPRKVVIVMGIDKEVDDFSQSYLNKFSAILLATGNINEGSVAKLNRYINEDRKIFPDFIAGERSLNTDVIVRMLKHATGNMTVIKDSDVKTISYDEKTINLPGKSGFLLFSEKYSLYDGWIARADGKNKKLLRANGVVTSIFLENEKQINFKYKPKSYTYGLIITILTILILVGYFVYDKMKKPKINS